MTGGSGLVGRAIQEEIEANPKIEILTNTNISKINGSAMVESVTLDSGKEFPVDGVFIEVGSIPSTALAKEVGVETDEKGFIKADCAQKTNVQKVFAAGDITTGCNHMWQIVSAAAEGAADRRVPVPSRRPRRGPAAGDRARGSPRSGADQGHAEARQVVSDLRESPGPLKTPD